MMLRFAVTFLGLLTLLCFSFHGTVMASEDKKSLTITDIMKFSSITNSIISDDGQWIAYQAKPDFGDSIGYVRHVDRDTSYQVHRGTSPRFSDNNRFVAFTQVPHLLTKEQSTKKARKKLTNNLVILDVNRGNRQLYSDVKSYQFSHQGEFVAILVRTSKNAKGSKIKDIDETVNKALLSKADGEKHAINKQIYNKKNIGYDLLIVNLVTGKKQTLNNVHRYSFSPKKPLLAYATSSKKAQDNRLVVLDLVTHKATTIISHASLAIAQLAWNKQGNKLAISSGSYQQKAKIRKHHLAVWQVGKHLLTAKTANECWFISYKSTLQWSFDQKRLFFSYSPIMSEHKKGTVDENNLFNIDRILAKKEMQTWHTEDALIKTQAAIEFGKDDYRHFLASFDVKKKKITLLADDSVSNVILSKNSHAFIGLDAKPYQKQQTWKGKYYDAYRVDVKSGKKQLIIKNVQNTKAIKVSQNGRYITYFKENQLWAFDSKKSAHKNLSLALEQSFVDQDNDRPGPAKAYGVHGWIADSDNFLAYDKYDTWQFDFSKGKANKLTAGSGREKQRVFRIITTDKQQAFVHSKQPLFLSSFNTENKQHGFYRLSLADSHLTKLYEGDKRYRFLTKAKNSDNYLYTREDYREFPDLWLGNNTLEQTKKLSHLGAQTEAFLWGKSQLLRWQTNDGKHTQGRLITPDNYDPNKRYPVLVYFYENYSDRLNDFSAMKVNHRPNLPFYNSNGYVIFQPDIQQIITQPGDAIVKSIVPGVQKLIEMGIADPDAIAIHGHSWGGYGTAYAITQTDIFAAAIAGAPVSNMTSAYSGIRLKTGKARQFQYETGQSRLGESLWEKRQQYIDNSPLFFADRIKTPLLIQFGDIDDAVPWQQGIELYLAMRRLGKTAVMLQYEGEPHHLKKYPNKLDYTIKVKQYLDHYLMGKPAPEWLSKGEEYQFHGASGHIAP